MYSICQHVNMVYSWNWLYWANQAIALSILPRIDLLDKVFQNDTNAPVNSGSSNEPILHFAHCKKWIEWPVGLLSILNFIETSNNLHSKFVFNRETQPNLHALTCVFGHLEIISLAFLSKTLLSIDHRTRDIHKDVPENCSMPLEKYTFSICWQHAIGGSVTKAPTAIGCSASSRVGPGTRQEMKNRQKCRCDMKTSRNKLKQSFNASAQYAWKSHGINERE